jgi:hypothetical protein
MRNLRRVGQSTAEYAILIGVVIAVAVGMQLYVKRGLQSKFKGVVDQLNFDTSPAGKAVLQYEPYYTAAGSFDNISNNTQKDAMTKGGKIAITGINDTTTRTGSAAQGVNLTDDDAWK